MCGSEIDIVHLERSQIVSYTRTRPDCIVHGNKTRLYRTWASMEGREKKSKRGSPTCLRSKVKSKRNTCIIIFGEVWGGGDRGSPSTIPAWDLREVTKPSWVVVAMTKAAVEETFSGPTSPIEGGWVGTSFEEVTKFDPGFIALQEFAICVDVVVGVSFATFAFDVKLGDCCGAEEIFNVCH